MIKRKYLGYLKRGKNTNDILWEYAFLTKLADLKVKLGGHIEMRVEEDKAHYWREYDEDDD